MGTSIRLTALVVATLVLPNVNSAQSISPSFSIAITVPQSLVKPGSEIEMRVVLTNVASHDIRIPQENGARAEFAYTITVKDHDGNAPPETEYFAAVKGKNVTKPGKLTLVVTDSYGLHSVKPGANMTDSVDLNKLYDLSQPGKYAIQVERIDDVSKTVVKSSSITITVVP